MEWCGVVLSKFRRWAGREILECVKNGKCLKEAGNGNWVIWGRVGKGDSFCLNYFSNFDFNHSIIHHIISYSIGLASLLGLDLQELGFFYFVLNPTGSSSSIIFWFVL